MLPKLLIKLSIPHYSAKYSSTNSPLLLQDLYLPLMNSLRLTWVILNPSTFSIGYRGRQGGGLGPIWFVAHLEALKLCHVETTCASVFAYAGYIFIAGTWQVHEANVRSLRSLYRIQSFVYGWICSVGLAGEVTAPSTWAAYRWPKRLYL